MSMQNSITLYSCERCRKDFVGPCRGPVERICAECRRVDEEEQSPYTPDSSDPVPEKMVEKMADLMGQIENFIARPPDLIEPLMAIDVEKLVDGATNAMPDAADPADILDSAYTEFCDVIKANLPACRAREISLDRLKEAHFWAMEGLYP